jgi:hypothetical protein
MMIAAATPFGIMARAPFVNPLINAPCCPNKRSGSMNSQWMHCGAGEVGTWSMAQLIWTRLSAMNSMFLASYGIALHSTFIGQVPVQMQQMIDSLLARANYNIHFESQYKLMDGHLYDIPLTEWLYTREFRPRQHLGIGNFVDDWMAMKMTSFTIAQLYWLYEHFSLRAFVLVHNKMAFLIDTNNFDSNTSRKKCYCIDPEELFLYSLTKIKTGMSQEAIIDSFFERDYSWWSYGHCWYMYYHNNCYTCIIGHEVGILRFLPLFGEFCDAIECYCQKD